MTKKSLTSQDLKKIGIRLRDARKKMGITTQKDAVKLISDATGLQIVNQQDLSRYESGQTRLSMDMLVTLSNTYNVSTDWILTGEDPLEEQKNTSQPLPLNSDWIRLPVERPDPLSPPERETLEDALYVLRSADITVGYDVALHQSIKTFRDGVKKNRELMAGARRVKSKTQTSNVA